jgi:predicted transcriptional regulator
MSAAIYNAAGGVVPTRPRTGQHVWRNSYHEGEREFRPWLQHNTFDNSDHNPRMRALEEVERSTRQKGRRNGALGHIALEVYRLLLRLRDRKTGRLDPSYDWIARVLNRSRSAVARAIARLKLAKFLKWQRRTRPVDDPEPGGQYVKQISNAYILELEGDAADLVRRIQRKPTGAMQRAMEAQRREAELAHKSTPELLTGIVDPELKKTLERLFLALGGANPPGPINGGV